MTYLYICPRCRKEIRAGVLNLINCPYCGALCDKHYDQEETPNKSGDPVSSPSHYTWHPFCECKDVVQHFPYNIGTAIAYLWRAERKNGIEDLQKAITHIQFEIDRLTPKP